MRRKISPLGELAGPCANTFGMPESGAGVASVSSLLGPLILGAAAWPRLMKWFLPATVTVLLNLPAPPAVGQDEPEQLPLLPLPDVSANDVAPVFSFKWTSSAL